MRYLFTLLLLLPAFCMFNTTPRAIQAAPVVADKKALPESAAEIAELLQERFDIAERIDNQKLRIVLNMFEERLGVTILIDHPGMNDNAVATEEANLEFENRSITIPKMTRVRAITALKYVCNQIDAQFIIENDHIKLTSYNNYSSVVGEVPALPQLYPNENPPSDTSNTLGRQRTIPIVTLKLQDVTLVAAMKKLNQLTGRTVTLSGSAIDQAETKVNLTLTNCHPETAITLLAEACNLRAMSHGAAIVFVSEARYQEVENSKPNPNPFMPMLHTPNNSDQTESYEHLRKETAELKESLKEIMKQLEKLQK